MATYRFRSRLIEFRLKKINILGGGVEIDGDLAFTQDGVLQSMNFERFFLSDAADLTMRAERDIAGALVITATGDYLNGAAMAEQIVDDSSAGSGNSDFDWGPGINLSARVDRMQMRGDVAYRGASLDMRRDAQQLQALDFSAFDQTGAPLTVSMTHTGVDEGPQRVINARTGAIGSLLAGGFWRYFHQRRRRVNADSTAAAWRKRLLGRS